VPAPPPVLLLDVDGVLNAVRRDLPDGWRRGTFNGYVLSWDPTVVARLRELHESGRVELQWLTTWTERADSLLAEPMGLPRGLRTHSRDDVLPTGYSGDRRGISGWWKLAAAQAVAEAEPGRRIVWIDDDLAEQAEDTSEWLATNGQVLVVAPDFVEGLTHAELDRVEAWLDDAG
jgi:HAD domain in Swiss Army Knife RNA repair proteins